MDLVFYKLHCLSEDYILINTGTNPEIRPEQFPFIAAAMCRRRTGPGACGVIFLLDAKPEPECVLYLPDGETSAYRSNAVLCISRYIFDSGLVGTDAFTMKFSGRPVSVDVIDSANFRLSLGPPLNPRDGTELVPKLNFDYTVPVLAEGKQLMVSPIRIIDTFLVHITDLLGKTRLRSLTDALLYKRDSGNPIRPVFMFIKNRDECSVRFIGRGSGGFDYSAACAAAGTAGILNGLLERDLSIEFRKEILFLQWLERDNTLFITAAPKYVYTGNFEYLDS